MAVVVGATVVGCLLGAFGKAGGFSPLLSGLVLLFAVPSFVILVLNVLDLVFHRALAGYLVGLFFLIGSSGAFFARLVQRGIATPPGPIDP